ncbi:MAG: hypothetical protein ACT6U0_22140, partial [Shinella sp.]
VMRLMKVFHRLLFVTALLGIVVGPMSIGAVNSVMAASGPVVIDGMAGMDMPDDMPCCPDQKPIKPDCGSKSCPLALLCTTAVVGQLALPQSWSLNVGWTAHRFLIPAHAEVASSLVDPPVRPPRV